jgi:cyclophilin family peptidyl-prolyl cis-trans isomerase
LVVSVLTASAASPDAALPEGLYAEFVTPRGTLTAELFFRQTPLTVASFVALAEGRAGPKPGTPFFDGLKFHRVVPNFVVQGGDPLGTGEGGPGYSFPDEFVPGLRHDSAGILSMANDGPDTNGSQFFFTLREVNRLNYLHSVFGRVVRGDDVLHAIQRDDVMTHVKILRLGKDAGAFRPGRAEVDALAAKTRRFAGPSAPGPAAHFDDPEGILPTEPPRALAFQRKLANFERATGKKIYARMVKRYTPAGPGQRIGAAAVAIAKQIGLPADSALAVYFADLDQWVLWIGDDYLPRFTGKTPEEIPAFVRANGLHPLKQEFISAARRKGDAAIADAISHAPADQPIVPAQKIKLQTDAILDALIFTFEPKP